MQLTTIFFNANGAHIDEVTCNSDHIPRRGERFFTDLQVTPMEAPTDEEGNPICLWRVHDVSYRVDRTKWVVEAAIQVTPAESKMQRPVRSIRLPGLEIGWRRR